MHANSCTGMFLQPKPNKEGVDGKTPKPARRPAQAAATDAAATAAPQGMPWSPDPAQRLPPWEASKPVSPQTAAPTSLAAAAPQPAPTPEEDKMSLAALAAGVTPAKAARVKLQLYLATVVARLPLFDGIEVM